MSADSIKAGGAVVTVGADTNPLSKEIEKAKSKIQAFGEKLQSTGQSIGMAAGVIGGIGAAIAAPFAAGLALLVDAAGPIASVARQTGMSLSEVQDTAAGLRISMEDMPGVIAKMSSAIVDARNPSSQMARNFRELGLSVEELNAASQSERIGMIADALSNVSDEARRIDLQRELFGRSGLNINVGGGAEGAAGRAARNRELGGFISPADIQAGLDYAKAQREVGIATKGISIVLGALFAPVMKEIAEYTLTIIMAVRRWVDDNRALLAVIIRVGAVLGIIGSLLALDAVRIMVVGKVIAFIGASIAPVVAAVAGFASVALPLAGILAGVAIQAGIAWMVFDAFGITLGDVWEVITDFFGAIIDGVDWISALTMAIISFAPMIVAMFGPAIAVIGLVAAQLYLLYLAINYVAENWWIIVEVAKYVFAVVAEMWNIFVGYIKAGVEFLTYLFPQIIQGIVNVFNFFVGSIAAMFNEVRGIVSGGVDVIGAMIGDMTQAFGAIGDAINAGNWTMAFGIAMTGIQLMWERTKNWLLDSWYRVTFLFGSAWDSVVNGFYGTLRPVALAIVNIVSMMAMGIQTALNAIIISMNVIGERLPGYRRLATIEVVEGAENQAIRAINTIAAPVAQREQQVADRARQEELQQELDDAASAAANAAWLANEERANGRSGGGPTGAAALTFGTGAGSFSAAALGQVGATNYAERTATAVEEANRFLREIRDGVAGDEGGVVAS